MNLIFDPACLPFTVALTVMLAIALLEGAGLVIGVAFSSLLDQLLPDVDFDPTLDVDTQPGVFVRLLGWLYIGKVPALVVLVAFLTAFGLLGIILQSILQATFGFTLPAIGAAALVFVASLPITRQFARGLAAILPKDETSAVSTGSFIGLTATITLGTASADNPAEARLTDRYNQTHYVMVVPDDEDRLEQGTVVLLVKQLGGGRFAAIRNTNEALVD